MWLSIYNKEWDITVIQPISSTSTSELFKKALVDIWIDLYLIKFQFLAILCVFVFLSLEEFFISGVQSCPYWFNSKSLGLGRICFLLEALVVSMSYLKTAVTPKVTTQDCGDFRSHHSLVLRHWPIELSPVTTSWTWAHMTGWCIQHNSDNGRQRWNFEHTKDYRYPISCTHRRVMGCTLWRLQRNWPVIRRLYCIYCIIQASCCVWSISPVRITWTYLLLGSVVIIFRI